MPDLDAAPRFGPDRLARIAEMERWHFWFMGRQAVVDQMWRKHLAGTVDVLDVGCGTGHTSRALAARGHRVVGLDMRPEGLFALRQAEPDARLIQAEAPHLPFAAGSFDAALLLDVLEHVDDRSLLQQARYVLRPGGWLVLTVPALPWLWSYRDRAAGHLRRYTRAGLRQALSSEGYAIRDLRYYQCLLLPLVLATRLFGRRGPALRDLEERPLPLMNALMTKINLAEVRWNERIAWPWGSSLVAVCQTT